MPVVVSEVSIAPPVPGTGATTAVLRVDTDAVFCFVFVFYLLLIHNPYLPISFSFLSQVDQQFYRFLSNFFELHSEFKAEGGKSRPIFFTGESHAGHYIPSMVAYILGQNEAVAAAGKVRTQAALRRDVRDRPRRQNRTLEVCIAARRQHTRFVDMLQ